MRYSSPVEIISVAILWAAALIVYDITFSKHVFQLQPKQLETLSAPQVSMWIQHVGCTGKANEVLQTLQKLPWLSKPIVKKLDATSEEGGTKRPEERQCDIGVLANIRNVEQADFMELHRALRAQDIIPTTLEFGGIPHFALKAKLANLCDTCTRVAMEALTPRKDFKGGVTLKWLDSKRINQKDQAVTAFVRFNNEAHIDEMIRALEQAGLPPLSIRVVFE